MARKSLIDDKTLIGLIDIYFTEECHGNVSRLTYAEIGQYIRANGYPEIKNYIISRNTAAREYIDQLKEQNEISLTTLVSYRTLDVEDFLAKNPGKRKLTVALTSLSGYYKTIAESSVKIFKKFREYEDEISYLKVELDRKSGEVEKLKTKNSELKHNNSELRSKNSSLQTALNKYVYPEIANKLLTDEGVISLPSDHIIEDPEVIKADNAIPFTRSLLSIFDED